MSPKSLKKKSPSKKSSRRIFPFLGDTGSPSILPKISRKKTLYSRLFGEKRIAVTQEPSPKTELNPNPLLLTSTNSLNPNPLLPTSTTPFKQSSPELPLSNAYEYYPITEKNNINQLKYNNGNEVVNNDELFLCTELSPIGKLGDIRTQNNKIEYFKNVKDNENKNNTRRIPFSEKFPDFASVPINDLPLYVGKRKN